MKLTKQPGNRDNGCCLTAALLNVVDLAAHKQALLGHLDPTKEMNVQKKEAYSEWQRWHSKRPHGEEAKYRVEGLQDWLRHLKDINVLDWYEVEQVESIKRNASVLLDIRKAGKLQPPPEGVHEGFLLLGYQAYDKLKGTEDEVGKQKLIEEEILSRLLGEGEAYKQAWKDPQWLTSDEDAKKGKVHPLTRYHVWEAVSIVNAEARTRVEESEPYVTKMREWEAHKVCVRAECEVGWHYRMRIVEEKEFTVRNEVTRCSTTARQSSSERRGGRSVRRHRGKTSGKGHER